MPSVARAQHALGASGPYDPAVPTPASVLGYELGERFTPHHMLMRYVDRVAAASPRVRLDTVARSVEGREVVLLTVTSEANGQRLDAIRADAARIADPRGAPAGAVDAAAGRLPVVVWLGFTVHGPEASGAEAALAVLYQLAAGQDAATRAVLDAAVVLIDPLQNPDGHERHVQDVMRMRTALGVPVHPSSPIHWGTWPGPRTSHYHFDLNRDWFAQSHPETRGRIRTMLAWHPHVAADLHEMGSNETYFFPPPQAPINRLVPDVVQRWWDVFAAGNREAFDREGWSYFRREGYDEFYPGYGSSWPIYTGAVGMTYEQASSRGGAIRRDDGTVLTLAEAARHHYAAAWATLETSARNARAIVQSYRAYRQATIDEAADAPFRAIAFARDTDGRADSLAALLARSGVEVQRLRASADVRDALAYGDDRPRRTTLPAGAYVVDVAQPQGRLARVLLEPDVPFDTSFVSDELFRRETGQESQMYDVTAWSLPFAFRVSAWGLRDVPGGLEAVPAAAPPAAPATARYGYAFAGGSEAGYRMLGGLLADSVRVWHAARAFRAGGRSFPHGAFVVRVAGNGAGVHDTVRRHALSSGVEVTPLASGGVDAGTDLGSGSVAFVRPPRVALLRGEPVDGQSYGAAWYAFDQRLRYPTTALDVDGVTGRALDDFDVLVVPAASGGALAGAFDERGEARIAAWVRAGGTLVTLGHATDWLATERLGLARLRPDTTRADTARAGAPLPADVPGAIVRVEADTLSALLAGVGQRELPVLVFSDQVYAVPDDLGPGEAVLRFAPEARLRLAGYLWPEAPRRLARSVYLWTETQGRGRVIGFAGDPNFRDQWRGLLPLFANAVFLSAR